MTSAWNKNTGVYHVQSLKKRGHSSLFPLLNMQRHKHKATLVWRMLTPEPSNEISMKIYWSTVKDNWRTAGISPFSLAEEP